MTTMAGVKSIRESPPDMHRVRGEFPILNRTINGKPLVYLDSAATTQKPRVVLHALQDYYTRINANVHRGVHTLSQEATAAYEGARDKVRRFINAPSRESIIFTRGTTESINLVAQSFARPRLAAGDEVLVTHMEHHSNIVPWQMVCAQTGAKMVVAPINDAGEVEMDAFARLLTGRTKIVAAVHVSNALGSINDIETMATLAHGYGAVVVVDGAQAAPHLAIDVQQLGCDFYAISAHKMYGPTGIGALYGRRDLLDDMPPYQGGGEMIRSVSFEGTTYNDLPHKFEAGTPNIAGAVGFGAAVGFLTELGLDAVAAHEDAVLKYGTDALSAVDGLKLIGTAVNKAAVLSFTLGEIHPHDIGTILDHEGVAVRTGHHCAQPVMDRFGIAATARASLGVYNTREDIDALVAGLQRVREVFGA